MPPVYTVSQVVAMMKDALERKFPSVDIEGEISNWRVYPSGHSYFVLKDEGAQLNAVLFARVPCDCRARLADGRRVKIRARVTMYPQRGECQLVVTRIKIAGEGELMARYLVLKAKLEAEGLFDSRRKKPLPKFPRHIGIVTSPSGAVVHDMCRVISRRFPNIEITLFPSLVQGEDAPKSIIEGLKYFNSAQDDDFDLLIVARGGGSFEDLFCFNDEALVRSVASSRIPVISAVGHETDFTLCDFAADFRAGTPSIAAEIAVPQLCDVKKRLEDFSSLMLRDMRNVCDFAQQRLDRASGDIATLLSSRFENTRLGLESARLSLRASLRAAAESFSARLQADAEKLPRALDLAFERAKTKFDKISSHLALLSPYAVLERGYSITLDSNGGVISDASSVSPGDQISTRLAHGPLISRVCDAEARPVEG